MQCHLARRSPKLPSSLRARFALRAVATYDFVVVGGGAAGGVSPFSPFVFSMVHGAGGLPEVVVICFIGEKTTFSATSS